MPPLTVALISPEIAPFAKTGGLADMVGSLGRALMNVGAAPSFFLPAYRRVPKSAFRSLGVSLEIPAGDKVYMAKIWSGESPSGVPILLLDLPELFDREGLYGEGGSDYPDNCLRFAVFCRTVLETIKRLELSFSILHLHDWQTALIPATLKTLYRSDPVFQGVRSLLTIHNIGYQGLFPPSDFGHTGLPQDYFIPSFFEFYGRLNLLKGGILCADGVTTVSPTYAREVLTPEFGFGLEDALKNRKESFYGVLNGIDEREWNPEKDPFLPDSFSFQDLSGKNRCKEALQRELGLPVRVEVPLFGMVSRLVDQKGIDLVLEAIPDLGHSECQWAILGQGDPRMEKALSALAETRPEQVAVKIGFDERLSHRITAGSDFLLMPSRYEPCGYNQMYGMHYGTIPIVRGVGGLADTVRDFNEDPERGTGIVFQKADTRELQEAISHALQLYREPARRNAVRIRGMVLDLSWKASAAKYLEIYEKILAAPPSPLPLP